MPKLSYAKKKGFLFFWRTLLIISYLKVFANVKGWKYYFSSLDNFMINGGTLFIDSGSWFEKNSLIYCDEGEIKIGKRFFINRSSLIVSKVNIQIGNDVLIADHVSIYDHDHNTSNGILSYGKQGYTTKKIVIEDKVWIGSHSVILKGVILGKGCVIAAGSVVTKSVPPRELWGGVPAKFIKKLDD